MSAVASAKKGVFQRFTAVDLVTIVVFAVLYRVLWYVWNAFSFLFPFNQILNTFFYTLCAVAALVIVRKVGVATLFLIGAMLVNVFLQGESLLIAFIGLFTGVFADVYLYTVISGGGDPWKSWKHMLIAGALLATFHSIALWLLMFKITFGAEMATGTLITVLVACAVGGTIGGAIGFALGDRIKGLIG
jgi:hypothetical protein